MDEEALLARLQALEQVNADRDRKEAFSAFMNEHGADFSNDEGFGNMLYDALISRVGPSASMEAQRAAYDEMLDGLQADLSAVQKILKRQARSTEDIVDQLSDEVDAMKDATKPSAPEEPAPEAAPQEDEFIPPEGFDMNAEPDYMGEELPPDMGMPAPDMGAQPPMPQEPAPAPAMDPNMMVSDERLKQIKACYATKKRG